LQPVTDSGALVANIDDFIKRWKKSSAAERSNFQPFMQELCETLGVPRPNPATQNESDNDYVFERTVLFQHDDGSKTTGRIDLYKRGCFVLEGKQSKKRENDPRVKQLVQLGLQLGEASFTRTGAGKREGRGWDAVMAAAKQQAESYAKALPKEDGWPPFIIVVDVGNVIEIYADFSLQGKHYSQFPDRQGYRIGMGDLGKPEIQERLRAIWTDPLSLDPARRTAKVTREIAELLALLSKSLEQRKYNAASVAGFLMRCLFTMFAEDVGLLKPHAFLSLLESHQGKANQLHLALPHLWQAMNKGGYSPTLGETILRFNGGLFSDSGAIPLDEQDLNWLILAAKRDWTNVEPAIFGTLLERALDDKERHKLGAHYTPRAYVERLVVPTIIEPLTEDWRAVQTEAADFLIRGKKDEAVGIVKDFHEKLCSTRVLDPACGTGNFLYVSMELMKRLEGEVLELLTDLGDNQYLLELDRHTVDPHQFLGLEINPRAVAIAELVLWIGYLQWHFRTRGKVMPAEPVLKAFANIRQQDAVLEYDRQEILRDKAGRPLTRWDGVTKKLHPITGEEIPDPDAQIELYKYVSPRPAKWPEADFILGNPPFHGARTVRDGTEPGYIEALRNAYPKLPEHADFVMFWWAKAADLVVRHKARRSGLITTKTIAQSFSRKIVEQFLSNSKGHLDFAIPNHPWVDERGSADVRIAITVLASGPGLGVLDRITWEQPNGTGEPTIFFEHQVGKISSNLSVEFDSTEYEELKSNSILCSVGYQFTGRGFVVSPNDLAKLSKSEKAQCIFPMVSARELTDKSKLRRCIDVSDLSLKDVAERYPTVFQLLSERVMPERKTNARRSVRDRWWIYGEARNTFRPALIGASSIVVTPLTAKHRFFVSLPSETRADSTCVMFALPDAFFLGVLSSAIHTTFALTAGGRLGVGDDPRYLKAECFDTFPFPIASQNQRMRIRTLAERLNSFRNERLAAHNHLTMTKLYNSLETLRSGQPLDEVDKAVYEVGRIPVLKQIHDELDQAVADAYGWPNDLSDEQILEKLVALNKERAAEERKGLVRWLRPEFQAPKEVARKPQQVEAELVAAEVSTAKPNFPKTPAEQVSAVRALLAAEGNPIRAGELARRFKQGRRVEDRVSELLQIMAAIGQAQTENGSRYFAAR
jgi:hypothetical protein